MATWAINVGTDNFSFHDLEVFTEIPLTYSKSTNELNGGSPIIHGHQGIDTLDRTTETFWLSPGNGDSISPFALEYIEYSVNAMINVVGIYPWGGNYEVFISVKEGGLWRGLNTIEYTPAGSNPYTGDDTPEINYITKGSVTWETPQFFTLPRVFSAERIRITLSNLQRTQWGPFFYRGGLREVTVGERIPGT